MYANCPHCQLSIKVRQPWAAPESCPRCIGRWRLASSMFTSPLPYRLLTADLQGSTAGGDGQAVASRRRFGPLPAVDDLRP